jgi:hypothetical protein
VKHTKAAAEVELQLSKNYFAFRGIFIFSLPLLAELAGLKTLNLAMLRQVFYHCAIAAGQFKFPIF